MAALIARIHLEDALGNRSLLDLREGTNAELTASLQSIGGTPLAMSNLQMRRPLPAFWADRKGTIQAVRDCLATGVKKVTQVEVTPAPKKARR